jgi:hypothetical protein
MAIAEKSLDHGAASHTSPVTRNLGVFLLCREGLVVRVVKRLRIGHGPLSPSLSVVTPRRAITRRPATRHARNPHERELREAREA